MASDNVKDEVYLAKELRKPIVVARLDQTPFSDELLMFLTAHAAHSGIGNGAPRIRRSDRRCAQHRNRDLCIKGTRLGASEASEACILDLSPMGREAAVICGFGSKSGFGGSVRG